MANHKEESLGFTFTYDVFLSFRGEDTRHKFIGHLRKELCQKGIKVFSDDKDLRIGEGISPALSSAIENSKILIVVFSENYAESTWCLDELVKILECTKIIIRDKKQLVFPIFYHVEPSDIRHQRNSYGEHMLEHQKRFGKDSQRVQAWRSALSEASNFPGPHISTGYETEFIEKIADKVYKNIAPNPLQTGQNPIGLGPRMEEVMSLLDMKPYDETVRMLGVWGLAGVGKTELATALYNNIVNHFDAASFLASVREKSNKINGLEDLQKTLLSEMREELDTELGSANKGMSEIKRKLKGKKVLLVLDDVDDRDKLEKLAGGRDWFGAGSRIIITTRDKDVLIAHQVDNIYQMEELDRHHSLELFCWNAFKQSHPKTGFEDVSFRAIDVAKGLPLALKVIGSDLAPEESLEDWKRLLKDYERNRPNEKIQDVLKISYDRLGNNPKQVFLDIACFFKGEKKEYVENILDEDFGAKSNIKVLVNKSLLTIENGCLKMHDLIQDMGRDIVRQEAPNPGECSRVWYHEDVIDILTDDLGSDKIQGVMLDPPQREEVDWNGTAFDKMKRLRILIVRNTYFLSEPQHLPNHLRVLDWEDYPSQSFPSKFHPKKIIVINLRRSHLTLEEPFKRFACLTTMNFSYNQSITEMPDVSEVQNLRELRLDHCRNLIAIHQTVGFLKRLAHLSASNCTKLRNFLQTMFLPSLEVLDLNLCVRLEHFPEIMKEMNKPLKIYMINTAIKELPESIGNLTGLVCIEIPSSRKLKYLPSSLFMLPNVVAFKIGGCSQLRESFRGFFQSPSAANVRPTLRTLYFGNGGLSDEDLLAILYCFPKLEELIASENNFVSLPECIKECDHLTSLDVSLCRELQKIPKCAKLRILNVHHCVNLEQISDLPSTVQKVDARYCFSLTRETSDMLWLQVAKGIRGLELVMPQTEIPEWFDLVDNINGGNPRFWARGKFPIIALALAFQDVSERERQSRRQLVELHLLINGRCVPRKGYYNFKIAADHVLICDLRLLFSDKEWLGLDAFLEHEWNLVQVSYEAPSTLTLSGWGVFVYEEGANMEDVQFMCPDPKYSDMSPTKLVPTTKDPRQERKKLIDKLCLDEMFDGMLMETMDYEERDDFADKDFAIEQMHILMGGLKDLSTQAKHELESNDSALQDNNKNSTLTWLLDTIKKIDNEEAEPQSFYHKDLALIELKDKVKAPMYAVEEASTSGDQLQEMMREIFYDGITDGLLEAQNIFPSLDIVKIRTAAMNKGNRVAWSDQGNVILLTVEMRTYMSGVLSGLVEAKEVSFPDLDIWATLNTVASRRGIQASFAAPPTVPQLDWTTVIPPSRSSDTLLEAFLMMKPESSESEAKSKLFWKFNEEHLLDMAHLSQSEDNPSFAVSRG